MASGDLESAGEAMLDRSEIEQAYLGVLQPEIERFVEEVRVQATERPGSFTAAWVAAGWAALLASAKRRTGFENLGRFMADHPLPTILFSAASGVLSDARADKLPLSGLRQKMKETLGLLRDPEKGEWGRVTGSDGETLSWEKSSRSLARTAATASLGSEMIELLRDQGYTHKRWTTRYDSRVRDTHANADRKTILLDEEFIVGGATLRYPGDPMCSDIGEVINCRCVLVGVKF